MLLKECMNNKNDEGLSIIAKVMKEKIDNYFGDIKKNEHLFLDVFFIDLHPNWCKVNLRSDGREIVNIKIKNIPVATSYKNKEEKNKKHQTRTP